MRIILCFLMLSTFIFASEVKTAELVVTVTDDESMPLANADVRVEYQALSKSGKRIRDYALKGKTDLEGKYSFQAQTTNEITISASNEGFHKSTGIRLELSPSNSESEKWIFDSSKTTIQLISEVDPVDIYHRKVVNKVLNTSGVGVGFDFQKGDWVSPHGQGVYKDIVFKTQGEFTNHREHSIECQMSFSDSNGGVLEEKNLRTKSSLSHKRTAPISGYESQCSIKVGKQSNYEIWAHPITHHFPSES